MTADLSLTPAADGAPPPGPPPDGETPSLSRRSFAALTLGAIGVVFGDIGTSPIYALREALAHSRANEAADVAVFGVVSLILWTLTLIVTVKYVIFLLSADNRGEGGSVALMALAPVGFIWAAAYAISQASHLATESRRSRRMTDELVGPTTGRHTSKPAQTRMSCFGSARLGRPVAVYPGRRDKHCGTALLRHHAVVLDPIVMTSATRCEDIPQKPA